MAEVHGELHAPGDDVARIRVHQHLAHGAARVRLLGQGDGVDALHQRRRGQQGVAPQAHGRGAGVRLHALHRHVKPALAQGPADHADGDARVLQHRALLDVGLEVGAEARRAVGNRRGRRAGLAGGLQRLAHAHALGVTRRQRVRQAESAGVHARAHHHGHEARALLVRPHAHLQRGVGAHTVVVQRVQHLQPGEHAVVAVELAARGLGVDVAARGHRGQAVIRAGTARKQVADGVAPQGAAQLGRPGGEELAALAVQVGQGNATHAAARCGADGRQRHQALPQARTVHMQRRGGSTALGRRFVHRSVLAGCAPLCGPTPDPTDNLPPR